MNYCFHSWEKLSCPAANSLIVGIKNHAQDKDWKLTQDILAGSLVS